MKLTWHPAHSLWTKVVGKRLAKDGKRLVQAQHYFRADRDASEAAAASLTTHWKKIKSTWKREHQPHLELSKAPFPDVPHWYRNASKSEFYDKLSDEDRAAIYAERDETTPEEAAHSHADIAGLSAAAVSV